MATREVGFDNGPVTLRQLQEMTGHSDPAQITVEYAGCGSHSLVLSWPDDPDQESS